MQRPPFASASFRRPVAAHTNSEAPNQSRAETAVRPDATVNSVEPHRTQISNPLEEKPMTNNTGPAGQPASLDYARVGHLPGRCTHCGFHVATQGHRDVCHRKAPVTPEARQPITDFIAHIKAKDARKAARQRAIAPPHRPRRRTRSGRAAAYASGALRKACEAVENSSTRNVDLNKELFNLGQIVAAGELDRKEVETALADAARRANLPEREIRTVLRDDDTGGMNRGIASGPRNARRSGR